MQKTIRDAKGYTSALDFDANGPLLIPTPGNSLPGGATPLESPSSATSVPAVSRARTAEDGDSSGVAPPGVWLPQAKNSRA